MSDLVTENLPLIATAPDGIKRLRGLILELAVCGKLVPQDPADEPASELLKRIEAEKARPVKEGRVRKPKAPPKPAESAIPFDLPDSWQWRRLDQLADVVRGVTYQKADAAEAGSPGLVALLRGNNIGDGLNFDKLVYVPNSLVSDDQMIRRGDIVIAMSSGSANLVGKAAQADDDLKCGFGAFCGVIRSFSPEMHSYFGCFFQSPYYRLQVADQGKGIGINNLQKGSLLNLLIPVPPLPEQHRIVARVDELMALCDRLEAEQGDAAEAHARLVDALLATLVASRDALDTAANWQRLSAHFDTLFTTEASITALKQTVLQLAVMGRLVPQDPTDEPASELLKRIEAEKTRLVKQGMIRKPKAAEPVGEELPFDAPRTWRWAQLCQLATEGPRNGYSPKPAAYETPYRCLTLSATTSGSFREECYKFVDIPLHIAEQHYLKNGDLLIQRGNSIEYVGIAALYEGDDDEFLYPDLMIRLRLSQQISRRYVHFVLVSNFGRSYFTSRASGTQGSMPKVNHGVVSSTPIPLPPLPEQHRIVAKVDELMALCDRLQAGLATAREHRARLADTLVQAALEAA